MLWLLLATALAFVEQRFHSLPELTDLAFDVVEVDDVESLLSSADPEDIIRAKVGDYNFLCVLEPELASEGTVPLEPLQDPDTLEAARYILMRDLPKMNRDVTDDVWVWRLFWNRILQFLPNPHSLLKMEEMSAVTMVGGFSHTLHKAVDEAEPVVVKDEHMMLVTYAHGDICDITGTPRHTYLYCGCDPEAVNEVSIRSVDEPFTCSYEIVIGMSGLCEIPQFAFSEPAMHPIWCGLDPDYIITEVEEPMEVEEPKKVKEPTEVKELTVKALDVVEPAEEAPAEVDLRYQE